jgi:hypothetical protein
MVYTSNDEIPQQVRAVFDEKDQETWRVVYNEQKTTLGLSAQDAWKAAWHIVAPHARFVSGILSREVVDDQKELVVQDALVDELQDLIFNGGAQIHVVHSNHPGGVWYDAVKEQGKDGIAQTRVYGCVYKGKPFYDMFWSDLLTGKLPELSVGLMKIEPTTECKGKTCWKRINQLQVFEGSPVPKGACPGTVIDQLNYSAKNSAVSGPEEGTSMEEKKETSPAQSPAADSTKKEALGDLGIEALQRLLMLAADTNKKIDALAASLNEHMTSEEEGMQEPGEEKPGEPGEEKKEPGEEKVPEKKEEKNSDKAIAPPMAPTNPASKDDKENPEAATKCPCNDKAAEAAQVAEIKAKAEVAASVGVTTPRPNSASNDQGGKRTDALTALLNEPDKLRAMSAVDIEKFAIKYSKGEI